MVSIASIRDFEHLMNLKGDLFSLSTEKLTKFHPSFASTKRLIFFPPHICLWLLAKLIMTVVSDWHYS